MMDRHSYELISQLMRADFDEGKLYWRRRPVELFASERSAKTWNRRFSGKEAGTNVCAQGYRMFSLQGRRYAVHRTIWLLHSGAWPVDEIDHINHDRQDNRLINLRSVSRQDNVRNMARADNNSSGVTGVSWYKQTSRWHARIQVGRETKHLGFFLDFDRAVAARKAAEARYGFHPNHGAAA